MSKKKMVQCVCCGRCYTPTGKDTKESSSDDLMVYGCHGCGLGEARNKQIPLLKDLKLASNLLGYLDTEKWVKESQVDEILK